MRPIRLMLGLFEDMKRWWPVRQPSPMDSGPKRPTRAPTQWPRVRDSFGPAVGIERLRFGHPAMSAPSQGRISLQRTMAPKIIVSYDGTDNDRDALALARTFLAAGSSLALAYVRHA